MEDKRLEGRITTEAPLRLDLLGDLPAGVEATIDGAPVAIDRNRTGFAIDIPAGEHDILLAPS